MTGHVDPVHFERLKIQSVTFGSANDNASLQVHNVSKSPEYSKYSYSRKNNEPIEFIQLREEEGPIVKVEEEDGLTLRFQLEFHAQEGKRDVTNLTCVYGTSPQQLDRLITREFSSDANVCLWL